MERSVIRLKTNMMSVFFISNIHTTFARSQKFKNRPKVDQKSKSLQEVLQEVFEKVLYTIEL